MTSVRYFSSCFRDFRFRSVVFRLYAREKTANVFKRVLFPRDKETSVIIKNLRKVRAQNNNWQTDRQIKKQKVISLPEH